MATARLLGLSLLIAGAGACGAGEPPAELPAGAGPLATAMPDDIVPLYGEVAIFKAATADGPRQLDLEPILQGAKVTAAVVVPFDAESWYEPKRVALRGTRVTVDGADVRRDLLVALDLGEVARNNYAVLTQFMAARGVVGRELRPKICSQILCTTGTFRARTLVERVPDMRRLPIDFGRALPDAPIGGLGRKSSLCDQCLEPPTNILPCFIWGCGEGVVTWPIRRRVLTRKNIYNLTPAEIDALRAGVAAMKARPATDPTSWVYQAKMHAVDSGTAAALQDQCQHRQFFFMSWHRMFTYYFERILRKASGNSSFTLPYWNYTDVAGQGVLPEPFRTPASSTNALYNSTRSAVYNGGVALPAADVSYSNAFALFNFTTPTSGSPSFGGRTVAAPAHFPSSGGSGRLEQSPHNNVHNDIGGEMATGESPRDPIFWLHHANIDRLWKKWIALGGGRTNPTGDTNWMNQTFTFFDENGAQVSLTGAQVLYTVSQLGYRYDDDPLVYWPYFWPFAKAITFDEAQKVTATETLATVRQAVRLTDTRQDVRVTLPPGAQSSLNAARAANFANERVILQLFEIQYDRPVGVSYLLFLNLPPDAKAPDHTHPNFIGTLGFFGKTDAPGHPGMSEGGLAEEYDVTAVVQRLGATDELRLSAVPSYPSAPADRPDLQGLVTKLKPQGNPRFGRVVILRQRIQ